MLLRESSGVTSSRLRDAVEHLPCFYYSIVLKKMLYFFLPLAPPQIFAKGGTVVDIYRTAIEILKAMLASLMANYLFYWLMHIAERTAE